MHPASPSSTKTRTKSFRHPERGGRSSARGAGAGTRIGQSVREICLPERVTIRSASTCPQTTTRNERRGSKCPITSGTTRLGTSGPKAHTHRGFKPLDGVREGRPTQRKLRQPPEEGAYSCFSFRLHFFSRAPAHRGARARTSPPPRRAAPGRPTEPCPPRLTGRACHAGKAPSLPSFREPELGLWAPAPQGPAPQPRRGSPGPCKGGGSNGLRARPGHRGAGKNSRLAQSLPGRSLNPTKDRHGAPHPLGREAQGEVHAELPPPPHTQLLCLGRAVVASARYLQKRSVCYRVNPPRQLAALSGRVGKVCLRILLSSRGVPAEPGHLLTYAIASPAPNAGKLPPPRQRFSCYSNWEPFSKL
jgi:hypothetical protein